MGGNIGSLIKTFNVFNFPLSNREREKEWWLLQILDNQRSWVELTLVHPLKPRVAYYFLFFIIVFESAFFVNYLFSDTINNLSFTLSISASVIITIIIFYWTQEEIKRLEYAVALKKLLIELGENKEKLYNFTQNVDKKFDELEGHKKWKWMPKQDSYTNWASGNNFQFKYFATNAYFNFVNRGHILNTKYLPIPKGQIANIYEIFFDFNIKLQHTENLINNFKLSDYYFLEIHKNTKKFYYKLLKDDILQKIKAKQDSVEYGTIKWHNIERDICPFETEKDIQKFLKCQFYNYYTNDHINNGFYKNYQTVYDQLSQYFDFGNKSIREKEKKKI